MIISELVSSLDFVCGTFFHREQYRVEKFFYRMGHRTLLSAADNALLERIVQRKSVIRPYASGHGNGGGYRGEPSVPFKGIH